ncbi:MAG TPA: SAF domain-containing protein [Acidimicrobiales bacterium]
MLALGAAALVAGQGRQAADTVAGLGARRSVAIARRDLEPGRIIAAGDVVTRLLPVAAIPTGGQTFDSAADVTGRVVTARTLTGEVVNRARVAPDGVSGMAALIPAGWRGVSVPRPADGSGLTVALGDVVDVLAPDSEGPSESAGAALAARAAVVIATNDGSVTVAVRADDAVGVATAVGRGTPVLALVGPEGSP